MSYKIAIILFAIAGSSFAQERNTADAEAQAAALARARAISISGSMSGPATTVSGPATTVGGNITTRRSGNVIGGSASTNSGEITNTSTGGNASVQNTVSTAGTVGNISAAASVDTGAVQNTNSGNASATVAAGAVAVNISNTDVAAAEVAKSAAIEVAKIQAKAAKQEIKNTPSADGPMLTSSNDTCMGSTSGSLNLPGFGLTGGSTWTDKNCKMLKNSRELWNMGMKEAALALMCTDAENREALESTGYQCPPLKPRRQE